MSRLNVAYWPTGQTSSPENVSLRCGMSLIVTHPGLHVVSHSVLAVIADCITFMSLNRPYLSIELVFWNTCMVKKKKKRSISFESAVSTKFNGLIPVIWLILSIFCTFLYLVLPLLWLWIGLLRFTDMNRNSFLNILTILLLVWKLC